MEDNNNSDRSSISGVEEQHQDSSLERMESGLEGGEGSPGNAADDSHHINEMDDDEEVSVDIQV